jgi:hypothetical protein
MQGASKDDMFSTIFSTWAERDKRLPGVLTKAEVQIVIGLSACHVNTLSSFGVCVNH